MSNVILRHYLVLWLVLNVFAISLASFSVASQGLTLSNFPSIRKRMHLDDEAGSSDWFSEVPIKEQHAGASAPHYHQMLTFHGELAFLIRTFFFVLLGAMVDFAGLRKNALLALGCFGAFVSGAVVRRTGRSTGVEKLYTSGARPDDLVSSAWANYGSARYSGSGSAGSAVRVSALAGLRRYSAH
jgi:hypothetical protein